MENVITYTQFWYLIKRTKNSAGIRANWINCLLYKVLLNLHISPVLIMNKNCTEPYLVRYIKAIYIYTDKIIVQFFECKIPERVLLTGAISICRGFSKASHRCEAKMCSLSLLANFKFGVFTVMTYDTRFVFQTKNVAKEHQLTIKFISKQARLNATKSVLVFFVCC